MFWLNYIAVPLPATILKWCLYIYAAIILYYALFRYELFCITSTVSFILKFYFHANTFVSLLNKIERCRSLVVCVRFKVSMFLSLRNFKNSVHFNHFIPLYCTQHDGRKLTLIYFLSVAAPSKWDGLDSLEMKLLLYTQILQRSALLCRLAIFAWRDGRGRFREEQGHPRESFSTVLPFHLASAVLLPLKKWRLRRK